MTSLTRPAALIATITVAEPRPDGGDDHEVWETRSLLERGERRGFDNPLRGGRV